LLFYYGGLVLLMPLWSTFFFIFILGNFGLPTTINFIGEVLIFLGLFNVNNFMILISLIGLFLTLIYSLFIYTRISTGMVKNFFIRYYSDLTRREYYYFILYLFFCLFFGIFPNIIFDYNFSSIFFWFY
jgi:NADH:ubiquinone oxidoreductase subunit 4 (subunit M)